jgi:hypothetical protein
MSGKATRRLRSKVVAHRIWCRVLGRRWELWGHVHPATRQPLPDPGVICNRCEQFLG